MRCLVAMMLAALFCPSVYGQAPADEPAAPTTRPDGQAGAAGGDSATAGAEDFWTGPQGDFRRLEDGRIVGPWWQGGGPAVVYFTGPHAQRHRSFVMVGEKIASDAGRVYLEIHKQHLLPSADDSNGILLYPDGTARVRLMLMPGGNSFLTMADLAGISGTDVATVKAEREKLVEARKIPQAAFSTGMSYVGACGGFFTADSGYDIPRALHSGWGLWPGKVANIGPSIRRPLPDVVFDPAQSDHPLYKATDDGLLKGMYYNGGPVGPQSDIADTEYFGKYRGGAMAELEGDWFLVAYKPADNLLSGRCVISTGHPEAYQIGRASWRERV